MQPTLSFLAVLALALTPSLTLARAKNDCYAFNNPNPSSSLNCGQQGYLAKPAALEPAFHRVGIDECADQCEMKTECLSFSWTPDNTTCTLYAKPLDAQDYTDKSANTSTYYYARSCFECSSSSSSSSSHHATSTHHHHATSTSTIKTKKDHNNSPTSSSHVSSVSHIPSISHISSSSHATTTHKTHEHTKTDKTTSSSSSSRATTTHKTHKTTETTARSSSTMETSTRHRHTHMSTSTRK